MFVFEFSRFDVSIMRVSRGRYVRLTVSRLVGVRVDRGEFWGVEYAPDARPID